MIDNLSEFVNDSLFTNSISIYKMNMKAKILS